MKKMKKETIITLISFGILMLWGIYELITCQSSEIMSDDPLILYYHLIVDKGLYNIQILGPLFVLIPSIYQFHKELSSGFAKNSLTRIEYKKYLINHYKNALKKVWILPVFCISLLLLCCIYLKSFSFGSGVEFYGYLMGAPELKYADHLLWFMIIYIINITLHSILYINLGLFYCKKYSNYLVNIILSYLTFIIFDIIVEIFVGNLLFAYFLNINITSSLNLFNVWIYSDVISLLFYLLYSLLLVLISFSILVLIYRNKEGVLIEIEK